MRNFAIVELKLLEKREQKSKSLYENIKKSSESSREEEYLKICKEVRRRGS